MDISARHGVYESLVINRFSSRLIISLSGLGDLDRDEIFFESMHSIAEADPEISSIYVRDTSRSWYTNENGFDGLVESLRSFVEHNNIEDITVYGVSMGGYGAIVLAQYIDANRAVAISPRTLLGEACGFDDRLRFFSDRLSNIRHENLANLDLSKLDVTIVSSIDVPEDAAHAALMVGSPARVLGAHGDHNVSLTLKKKGVLTDFLRSCINGSINKDDYGFFDLSNHLSRAIKLDVIDGNRQEAIFQLDSVPDRFTPSFLFSSLYERWINRYLKSPCDRCFDSIHAYPAHIGQIIEGPSVVPYLVNGWSDPEGFGVWGVGHHHSLRLELVDYKPGDNILIVVHGRVFAHISVPPIILTGYINGRKCIDSQLDSNSYKFESMITESILKIDFLTPNPMRPSKAGIGDDDRELSVAVTKILIEYRPPN